MPSRDAATDLITNIRRLGLEIPCIRIDAYDRDGKLCRPGVYHLTHADRRRLAAWQRTRQVGAMNASPTAGIQMDMGLGAGS